MEEPESAGLVLCTVEDGIATLTLNRPAQLNALSVALLSQMDQAVVGLEARAGRDVRAVVVTGSGPKAFAAGADIGEMKDLDPAGAQRYGEAGNRTLSRLAAFPAPVIAAVNGYALGGGFELALACDLILAAENAAFAFPEVSLGITPGFGGTQRLARLAGPGRAKDLIFSARRIGAAEALQLGIVVQVLPAEGFLEQVNAYARGIAAKAPLAVAAAKRAIDRGLDVSLEAGLAIETAQFAGCFASADPKMAMTAFAGKQKPGPFTGT